MTNCDTPLIKCVYCPKHATLADEQTGLIRKVPQVNHQLVRHSSLHVQTGLIEHVQDGIKESELEPI